jgi:hypothetical protein
MSNTINPYKRLMQGLYYPAVLGTGIVLMLQRIASEGQSHGFDTLNDISIYFAILFSSYFSISFLINEQIPDMAYGAGAFIVDLVEVVIVFSGYYFLGLFDKDGAPNLPIIYIGLIGLITVQNIWNIFVGSSDRTLHILSVLVGTVMAMAALWGYKYAPLNWSILIFLFVMLAAYFKTSI